MQNINQSCCLPFLPGVEFPLSLKHYESSHWLPWVIKQLHRITVMLGIEGHSWIIPAFYLWCKASNFSGWLVWQYPCSPSLHWAVRVWCRNQLEESVGGPWRLTIPFRNITVTQRCACCWPLRWADIASRCFISLIIRNSGSDPRFKVEDSMQCPASCLCV